MGSSTKTKQVGKGYTDLGVSALTNETNFGRAGLEGAAAGLTGSGPGSFWGNFMSQSGDLQGLIMGPQGDLQRGLTDRASELAGQATRGAASNLSGLGSLYSGATLKAAGTANAQAFGDVANSLGSQALNLYGNLAGGAMQAGQNIGLGLANLYGGLYGQGVGGLAGYGTPTFTQERKQGYGGIIGAGLGAGLGGYLGSIVPGMGTAAGAKFGATLGGGLGSQF